MGWVEKAPLPLLKREYLRIGKVPVNEFYADNNTLNWEFHRIQDRLEELLPPEEYQKLWDLAHTLRE